MKTILNNIQALALFSLILITSIQYSAIGLLEPTYSLLRYASIGVIAFVFLFSKFSKIKKLRRYEFNKIVIMSILIMTFSLLLLTANGIGWSVDKTIIRDTSICLCMTITGICLRINDKVFNRILSIFTLLITVSSITIIYTFGNGFMISDHYLPVPKNQISPLYATLLIISVSYILKNKGSITKYFWITHAALLFCVILILRSRATIISTVFICIVYILLSKELSKQKKLFFLLTASIFLIILIPVLINVFAGGKDVNDIDSLSSGRVERIYDGLDYLNNNLFLGGVYNKPYNGKIIHVFILKLLVDYGIILSIPMCILYFSMICWAVRDISRRQNNQFDYAPYMLTILFLISLFEYSYPFSPASSTYISYICMGKYLTKI